VRAYANRSLTIPLHRLGRNTFLLLAAVVVLAIQVAIPYLPPLAEAFHATPLEPDDWAVVAVVAFAPAVLAEVIRTARGRLWIA
jgi:Ca2+-transporting ATPase